MSKPYLSLEQIDMVFSRGGASTQVLNQVSLNVDKGEFISIIGHSGCGKSTLLNIVAGLTEATRGVVLPRGSCRRCTRTGPGGGVSKSFPATLADSL